VDCAADRVTYDGRLLKTKVELDRGGRVVEML
jgi:hypothetical protein